MKEFIIADNDVGKLIKFIQKTARNLPESALHKALRKGRVRVNGMKIRDSKLLLAVGDVVQLYINDEFFGAIAGGGLWKKARAEITIIYEDENILVCDKPVGLLSHEDASENVDTLINRVKRLLYERGEWAADDEHCFAPALCHRLDRNTSGLVVIAKNAASLREMAEIIKNRWVKKFYRASVFGEPKVGEYVAYLEKLADENRVRVFQAETTRISSRQIASHEKSPSERKQIVTVITNVFPSDARSVLQSTGVEIELVTGRTHQIRAHLAHLGWPLVGDNKYGNSEWNKQVKKYRQELVACRVVFGEEIPEKFMLNYLKGMEIEI